MERKIYEAEIKRFTGEGRGAAVLARLGVRDRDGDVLVPGLLGGEQQAPLIESHQWQLAPIGRAAVREQGDEMLADFTLNLETARGREWASVLKFDLERGPIQQWSWAFTVPPGGAESGMHEGQPVRFLKRIQLHEVSPVVVGASVGSRTLALKGDLAQDQAEIVRSGLATLARGAAYLAKLEGMVPYRNIVMEGFTLLDPRRHLARDVAFRAAADLGISVPKIRFFTSCDKDRADFTDEPMWGYAGKDGIAIEWTLSPAEMTQVVAHEVAHAAGLDEEAAGEFGRKFAARYGAEFGTAPRRGGHWSFEQLVGAAAFVRHRGGF